MGKKIKKVVKVVIFRAIYKKGETVVKFDFESKKNKPNRAERIANEIMFNEKHMSIGENEYKLISLNQADTKEELDEIEKRDSSLNEILPEEDNRIEKFIKGLNKLCNKFDVSIQITINGDSENGEEPYMALWDLRGLEFVGLVEEDEDYGDKLSKEELKKILNGRPFLPVKYVLNTEEA